MTPGELIGLIEARGLKVSVVSASRLESLRNAVEDLPEDLRGRLKALDLCGCFGIVPRNLGVLLRFL